MMAENIHKAYGLEKDYFMLRNKDVQREDLSYEAIGMLAYLMSLPLTWEIRVTKLERNSAGREKIRRIINELVDKGYLALIKNQDEKGHFIGSHYEAFAIPEENPHREAAFPTVGETENRETRPLINKEVKRERKEKDSDNENSKPKERARNPLYDAVALHVFGFDYLNLAHVADIKANNGRIVKLVAYLKEKESSPELLVQFKIWYLRKFPSMDMVKDLAKFSSHYSEFLKGLDTPPLAKFEPNWAATRIQDMRSEAEIIAEEAARLANGEG